MKIWHISDTHGYHDLLEIPDDVDMVIHSGDATNHMSPYHNETEFRTFLDWFIDLDIVFKVYIPGNHDTALEKGLITQGELAKYGIYYVHNYAVEVAGLKIWGSGHTPRYGNWAFMKQRHKLGQIWENIPVDTDIVVVHGPPKGIMDLSISREGLLERCGCNALKKAVLSIEPLLFLSGHIHNYEDLINAGVLKLSAYKTIFSNGSVVTDRKFGKLSSNGNLFDYDFTTKKVKILW